MTAWNLTLQILPTGVAILLISGLLRAAGGTFDPPRHLLNPIGQLARSLSLSQRQRQHQVCCASDGGGLRAPLLIQPGPGVPVLPLSSRIGIHVSPWKHKIAILKATRVDFKQHQKTQGKGFQSQPFCVYSALWGLVQDLTLRTGRQHFSSKPEKMVIFIFKVLFSQVSA